MNSIGARKLFSSQNMAVVVVSDRLIQPPRLLLDDCLLRHDRAWKPSSSNHTYDLCDYDRYLITFPGMKPFWHERRHSTSSEDPEWGLFAMLNAAFTWSLLFTKWPENWPSRN